MTFGSKDRGEQDVWYPIRVSALSLALEAKAVDRRALDVLPPDEHLGRLAPFAQTLLARAVELLDQVVSTCGLTTGRRPPPALSFELALDTAVRSAFDVGDLAQLIRVEFRRRIPRLTQLGKIAPSVALPEFDRAVAGVAKALSALDLAAARASDTPELRSFGFELDRSLSARRAYAKLSLQITSALVPGTDAPRFRFRGVLEALRELVAHDTYPELRVGDRLLLRAAQKRLELWSSLPSADPGRARMTAEIARELRRLTAVLARINLRQELVDHDSALLRQAREHVDNAGGETFAPELAFKLHELRGFHPTLDLLLVGPDALRVEPWRRLLGSLTADCAQRGAGPAERTTLRRVIQDDEPTVKLPRAQVREALGVD